jgi:ABC-2 type transport system permease protein
MEFKLTAANRAFLIITIVGPFLIAAIAVLPGLLATSESFGRSTTRIALAGVDEELFLEIKNQLSKSKIETVKANQTIDRLDELVLTKELDGYIHFPEDLNSITRLDYVSRSTSDYKLLMALEGVIGRAIISMRLVREGLDPDEVKTLTTPPGIEVKNIRKTGEKEKQDINVLIFTGVGFTLLLYMTVLMYGLSMGRAVLTEKLSKTVEIMLSSVNTRQLLFGKILGKAGAGLFQYAVWIGMAMILLKIIGPRIGIEVFTIEAGPILFYMVLFFLLAFFLYASIYAALGAASEDEQHLFQLSWPLMIFLILPMVAVGAIIALPDNPVITGLSLFPLTSPIVMFQRILAGQPPAWQIILSIFILLGTISVAILLSAKIFRIGILMTGKRFNVREVLRWLVYKG